MGGSGALAAKTAAGGAAQGHGHGETLAQFPGLLVMGRASLVPVPVHAGGCAAKYLHAVHARILAPGFRVFGDYLGKGDERPAVFGPAGQHRKRVQARVGHFLNDLLAGGRPLFSGGKRRKAL